MAQKTRLGLLGAPASVYGSFAGKTEVVPTVDYGLDVVLTSEPRYRVRSASGVRYELDNFSAPRYKVGA